MPPLSPIVDVYFRERIIQGWSSGFGNRDPWLHRTLGVTPAKTLLFVPQFSSWQKLDNVEALCAGGD